MVNVTSHQSHDDRLTGTSAQRDGVARKHAEGTLRKETKLDTETGALGGLLNDCFLDVVCLGMHCLDQGRLTFAVVVSDRDHSCNVIFRLGMEDLCTTTTTTTTKKKKIKRRV